MSNITLEKDGSRYYIRGNTYAIKDALKSAGAHWDGAQKAWWVGASKKEKIEEVISGAKPEKRPIEGIKGKAIYKGKSYFIAWSGITRKTLDAGRRDVSFRLVSLDESVDFWASEGVTVEKEYQEERTLASIRRFIEEKKKEEQAAKKSAHVDPAEVIAKSGRTPVDGQVVQGVWRSPIKVGEIVRYGGKPALVVGIGKSYYMSEEQLEDMDNFRTKPGHCYPGSVVVLTPSTEEISAEEAKAKEVRKVASRGLITQAIQQGHRAAGHPDARIGTHPDGPKVRLWTAFQNLAGSRIVYLVGDDILFYAESSTDDWATWWVQDAELAAKAKEARE